MDWKHLLWIIPLTFIIALIIGIVLGFASNNTLSDTVDDINMCTLDTLTYTSEHNSDCKILIAGYLQNCTEGLI